MKFKALAATALLAASGLANAAVTSPGSDVNNTGGSELILNVVTTTSSYTLDLGIDFGSITDSSVFSFSPSTALQGLLGDVQYWNVLALDSVEAGTGTDSATYGRRVQSTSGTGAPAITALGQIGTQNTAVGAWVDNLINNTATHDSVANGESVVPVADGTSFDVLTTASGGISGSNSLVGGLGDTLAYYLYTETGTVNSSPFGTTFNADSFSSVLLGAWTLASDGTLSFNGSNVGVPEVPVPAAVWLFGSALIGLVGAGRRKAA